MSAPTTFSLRDSPFRNIFSFHKDDIVECLLPSLGSFVSEFHDEFSRPIPPVAFLFTEEQGFYLNGYSFPSREVFLQEVRSVVKSNKGKELRLLYLAEVGSLSGNYSTGLLVVSVESRSFRVRKAYSAFDDTLYDIVVQKDIWLIDRPSLRDQLLSEMSEAALSDEEVAGLSLTSLPDLPLVMKSLVYGGPKPRYDSIFYEGLDWLESLD